VQQAAAVCADESIAAVDAPPLLARLVEQSMVQAGGGRFWLLETLRTYAAERLDPAELRVLAQRHAEHTAATLGELRLGLGSDQEPGAVVSIAALIPDLHVAWEHARVQDRSLAVQLAADVLDYAYQRQRRDLLEWGLAVSGWDVEHPKLPAALTAAACSAWIGGRFTEAADLAARGLAVATTFGQDAPAAAGPLVQLANLAMFGGRTTEARSHYSRAAELMAAAGMQVGVMMAQISISQVLVYEGRLDEAATRMRDLLEQARATGMPSAIAWAHFVSGEAAADIDPEAARASYQAAIEVGSTVDNRLFVNLARTAAMGLTARHGSAASALDEINHLMEQWEDLRNEAGHWWVLLYLAELLVRIGQERDGAVLSGAVLSSRQRHWMLVPDESRLHENLRLVREALGDPATEEALAIGSRMPYAEAVAFARDAIDRARERLPRT
jgi:tetratricopeptide (TPR) repeat protein